MTRKPPHKTQKILKRDLEKNRENLPRSLKIREDAIVALRKSLTANRRSPKTIA